jgi:galactokinase
VRLKVSRPDPHEVFELVSQLGRSFHVDCSGAFVIKVPLRICPLGAHVDHQGGVVTGMTIDRWVLFAATPDPEPLVAVESLEFPGAVEIDLKTQVPPKRGDWGDYARAAVVALALERQLHTGLRGVLSGDLPGAGLSSSAAVLVAYLLALARVNGLELGREGIAALVQRAENDYVGVASGRLDQSIILFAERGCLTRVACSDGTIHQVPYPESAKEFDVLVCYSGLPRGLAGSAFNTRVAECWQAAKILLELNGESPREDTVLSEVSPDVFERFASDLPPRLRLRATHYFGEQQRVRDGVEAWRQGDIEGFGSLMTASGASSIHNYESGTVELITLYELLRDMPEVFGARFSGGGFGGSCVALIERGAGGRVIEAVGRGYASVHPKAAARASFHVCRREGPARFSEVEV